VSTPAATACRSCGAAPLSPVLSLGRMPLPNRFLLASQLSEPEPRFPLDLAYCPGCTLVQITETVPPGAMFSDYLYLSSFSETMVGHVGALTERLIAERRLGRSSLVIELASNDGYLLRHYAAAGVPVLGIEPAENVAAIARERHGIPTRSVFFGEAVAEDLAGEGRLADVVHAHNVLAHVPDLNGFVRGIRRLLKPDGLAVIEVPYVREMLARCEFDTIYHEHLCYFSLQSLDALCRRADLTIADVRVVAVHGGSLQLYVVPAGAAASSPQVAALLDEEQQWARAPERYRAFADQVQSVRHLLRGLLLDLARAGRRIAAYGASAKGTVLLNFCGIGPDLVEFVADRNPHKQGRFVPGVHVPVVAPEVIADRRPDYMLLLVWNIADEVLAQQAVWRQNGGRFIVPVPHVSLR
jgi:SAM-dependent methyltransferase